MAIEQDSAVYRDVEVTAVANGGHGVARIDGQVCFIPYALPGDRVHLREVRKARGVLWGALEEVVEPSESRCEPGCPVFGECGGCLWLHFAYPAQAEWKCRTVADCLERLGGVEAAPEWLEQPDLRLGYRTRAEFHALGDRWGFFHRASHEVVEIKECPLCHPALNQAFERLRGIRMKGSVELTVNPEGEEVLAWAHRPNTALRGGVFRWQIGRGTGGGGTNSSAMGCRL